MSIITDRGASVRLGVVRLRRWRHSRQLHPLLQLHTESSLPLQLSGCRWPSLQHPGVFPVPGAVLQPLVRASHPHPSSHYCGSEHAETQGGLGEATIRGPAMNGLIESGGTWKCWAIVCSSLVQLISCEYLWSTISKLIAGYTVLILYSVNSCLVLSSF